MVTFLLLFTSRKSFQSASFSLSREQGSRRVRVGPAPPQPPRSHCHLLHSVWTWSCRCWGRWGPPAWGHGQKLNRGRGAWLPLHLPARLEQPGGQG